MLLRAGSKLQGFLSSSDSKESASNAGDPDSILGSGRSPEESASNAGDPDSILGSGRSPEEGIGNSLQYSCLENSMDRGAW